MSPWTTPLWRKPLMRWWSVSMLTGATLALVRTMGGQPERRAGQRPQRRRVGTQQRKLLHQQRREAGGGHWRRESGDCQH